MFKRSEFTIWYLGKTVSVAIEAAGDAMRVSWSWSDEHQEKYDLSWFELDDEQQLTVLKLVWRMK